jgi:hypothetical protein
MNLAMRVGACGLTLTVVLGCTQSKPAIDPDMLAAQRARLSLDEEPDGAAGVLDVREMLVGTDDVPSQDSQPESTENPSEPEPDTAARGAPVVVVGRIGGVPNPWKQARPDYPWSADQAEFVIADAAAAAEVEEHGHAHADADHDCPFCAAAANSDVVAVVRFHDEAGKVIPADARQLFNLQGEETVVVRGKAKILGDAQDGILLVEADGLYVRR